MEEQPNFRRSRVERTSELSIESLIYYNLRKMIKDGEGDELIIPSEDRTRLEAEYNLRVGIECRAGVTNRDLLNAFQDKEAELERLRIIDMNEDSQNRGRGGNN